MKQQCSGLPDPSCPLSGISPRPCPPKLHLWIMTAETQRPYSFDSWNAQSNMGDVELMGIKNNPAKSKTEKRMDLLCYVSVEESWLSWGRKL